jgi:hypothetical protein
MSLIDAAFQARMEALSGTERVSRSLAWLHWSRAMIARQIIAAEGPMSADRLKWEVALRCYGGDPAIRGMIERILADVPH